MVRVRLAKMIFIESGEAEVTVTKGEISTVVARWKRGTLSAKALSLIVIPEGAQM